MAVEATTQARAAPQENVESAKSQNEFARPDCVWLANAREYAHSKYGEDHGVVSCRVFYSAAKSKRWGSDMVRNETREWLVKRLALVARSNVAPACARRDTMS